MPKILKLSNIGNKGLNTDVSPWELPPEFLTFGANFRSYANFLQTTSGTALWSTPVAGFNAGFIMHVGATSGDYWIVAGRTGVYAFDGNVWTDISSVAGYAGLGLNDELNWTGCQLGSIPIINNPQAAPEYWSPVSPGQILQPLPFDVTDTWADLGYSCRVMRSHKNFLFALNLQEGLSELPNAYRWSNPADINGLPFTWDETDPSGLAGRAQLGGDGGQIVDGLTLRDSFCIYSENGIDLLDLSGDEFVWRRRELSQTAGLLSKQSLIEVKGAHFFLADGDIVRNDGNGLTSLVHNRIKRQLTARMSVDYYNRSYAVRNRALKEIWFCVPEEDAEYPNIAYIYNWKDDSWSIKELPENIAYAGYGPQATPTKTWDTWQGTWDTQQGVWGSRVRTPLDDTIVGVDNTDSSLVILDPTSTQEGEDIASRIERTDFPLEGMNAVTTITRVYPHMEGTEPVDVQLGSQDFAGGPVRWKPAVMFTPGVDRKVDIRTTGELHCWRIQSIGSGHWRLSGMDIEYSLSGAR